MPIDRKQACKAIAEGRTIDADAALDLLRAGLMKTKTIRRRMRGGRDKVVEVLTDAGLALLENR